MMEAQREQMLGVPIKPLDMVLARHIGMKEPLEYEWQSLLDLSDMEIAQASKTKAEALGDRHYQQRHRRRRNAGRFEW